MTEPAAPLSLRFTSRAPAASDAASFVAVVAEPEAPRVGALDLRVDDGAVRLGLEPPRRPGPPALILEARFGPIPAPDETAAPSAWALPESVTTLVAVPADAQHALPPSSIVARTPTMVLVAALMAMGVPTPALASPPVAAQPADPDPAVAEAQELFRQGTTRYDTSDYPGAVDYFTQAYARAGEIQDKTLREQVLHTLYFNLARAHVRAYDMDTDKQHLNIAQDLLKKYRGHDEFSDEMDADTLEDEIAQRLDSGEESEEDTTEETPVAAGPEQEKDEGPEEPGDGLSDEERATLIKKSRAMWISGAALTGLGGAVAIGGGVWFLMQVTYDPSYAVLTGGVIAGVGALMIGGGIPLLVIGKKREKRLKAGAAQAFRPQNLRLMPARSRNGWGGALSFQF